MSRKSCTWESKPHNGSATYLSTSAGSRESQSNGVLRRRERLVEGPKEERLQQRALAVRTDSQPLELRDVSPQPRGRGGPAVRSGKHRCDDRVAMVAQELLDHERSERMAQNHDGRVWMIRANPLVELPQVLDAPVPSLVIGEVAQVGGRLRRTAVSPMVVGVDRVSRPAQGLGHPRVSAGVLGPTVGDLHHRLRRLLGQPAINEERNTIGRFQLKCRSLHESTADCHRGQSVVLVCRAGSADRPRVRLFVSLLRSKRHEF